MVASAIQMQRRRGTQAQMASFTGAQGELAVDTTNNRVVVHDGSLPGGYPQSKLSEVGSMNAVLQGINLAQATTDNQLNIYLPPGYTRFKIFDAVVSDPSAVPGGSSTFGLFTATGGGGVTINSTSVTITSTAANTNNNAQTLTLANSGSLIYGGATLIPALYFRTIAASTVAATVNVTLIYRPLP